MARKARICVSGAIHHVTANLVDNRTLLTDEEDKKKFLDLLHNHLTLTGFELLSLNFYQTHYHIVLRINDNPLEALFRGFHSEFARYHNKRHGHKGYFFQGRPKSVVVQDGESAQKLMSYVHTGPIRAGLCKTIEELDAFSDGTHCTVMGTGSSHFPFLKADSVLSLFNNNAGTDPKVLYRESIKQFIKNVQSDKDFFNWIKGSNRNKEDMFDPGYWVIGSQKFVQDAMEKDSLKRARVSKFRIYGWNHDNLAQHVAWVTSVPISELKNRGRLNSLSDARKLYCYFAVKVLHMTTISTALRLDVSRTAVARMVKLGKVIAEKKQLHLPENPLFSN